MSRLPGKTLARRIPAAIAGTAAVVALTAGSAMISAGTAAAEPVVPEGIAALIAQAAAISPEASAAVQQLIGTAGADQITTALDLPDIGVTKPQSFMYPAPTVGCGVAGEPVTVTLSSAQAGPNFPLPPWVEADHLRFQAIPGYVRHTQDLRVECCLDQRRHVQGRHRPVGREVARTRYAVALEGRRHR